MQSQGDDFLLLIISSPSGAGKTTLTRRLLSQFPDLTFSVSHTTRPARAIEVPGQDYHFVSRERFDDMVAKEEFAEWAEVHGNRYGTACSELVRARREGKYGIVFDVDYQGARQIKATYEHAVGIFILPPTLNVLEQRLRSRGMDDSDAIERRFQKAREEIEHYPFFDYLIINQDLAQADAQLQGIVYAERCRRRRTALFAEALLKTDAIEKRSW